MVFCARINIKGLNEFLNRYVKNVKNKVKRCNGSTSDKFLYLLTLANFQAKLNLSQEHSSAITDDQLLKHNFTVQ